MIILCSFALIKREREITKSNKNNNIDFTASHILSQSV